MSLETTTVTDWTLDADRDAADHDGRPPGADDPPPVRSDGPWAAGPGTSMMNPSPGET